MVSILFQIPPTVVSNLVVIVITCEQPRSSGDLLYVLLEWHIVI